jgi:hypothetical protein
MAYGWQSGKSERLLRNSVDRVVFTGACSRQFFLKCDIKEGNESVVPPPDERYAADASSRCGIVGERRLPI